MEKLDVKRCCKILGLEPGATLAQLKEQRGRLAQQWHPDKEKDPKRKAILEDKMKDINNAFDFLKAALSGTPPSCRRADPRPKLSRPHRQQRSPGKQRPRSGARRRPSGKKKSAAKKKHKSGNGRLSSSGCSRKPPACASSSKPRPPACASGSPRKRSARNGGRSRNVLPAHGRKRTPFPPHLRNRNISPARASRGRPRGKKKETASTSISAGNAQNAAEAKSRSQAMIWPAFKCCSRGRRTKLQPPRKERLCCLVTFSAPRSWCVKYQTASAAGPLKGRKHWQRRG